MYNVSCIDKCDVYCKTLDSPTGYYYYIILTKRVIDSDTLECDTIKVYTDSSNKIRAVLVENERYIKSELKRLTIEEKEDVIKKLKKYISEKMISDEQIKISQFTSILPINESITLRTKKDKYGEITMEYIKKDELVIDRYLLGRQIIKLPKKLIVKIKCNVALAYSQGGYNQGVRLYTLNWKNLTTPHAGGEGCCLGDYRQTTLPKKYEELKTTFIDILKVLGNVNIHSLYHSNYRRVEIKKVIEFIKEKEREYTKNRLCIYCGKKQDDCKCDKCSDCGILLDDDNADDGSEYCYDCGGSDHRWTCGNCGERMNYNDDGGCESCGYCSDCCCCEGD